ncbi:hypothetical protein A2V82_09480 [candidate division KSB1 bacterium RBG_16_48_16]|nr:MAG: hypothetical protein A2V82_09480 [candidate division KSB1 bacterium RBG_16_48_16]
MHAQNDIWISSQELQNLPVTGAAWDKLKSEADKPSGIPNLSDQNDSANVRTMAKALVYARLGEESYRNAVISSCMQAIDSEIGGRTLALGRNLAAYVIAADLVDLPEPEDSQFREWLRRTLTEELDGRTLQSTHAERPNNWGTHCGASRIAVALYLDDTTEVNQAAAIFKGFLGDISSHSDFMFDDDLSWHADSLNPVPINPLGAMKDGRMIGGVLPDEQRRAGPFSWPPAQENYCYEGLQGVLAQAVMLSRAGYDVWNWQDRAMLRAFTWLHEEADFPAEGDDTWQPHIINYYYGTNFPAPVPSRAGKNVGWTCWTHGQTIPANQKPIVTTFYPTGGSETTAVTIYGFYFSNSTQLRFNDTSDLSYVIESDTKIRAYVPSGASTGTIKVANPYGTGESTASFAVTAEPVLRVTLMMQGAYFSSGMMNTTLNQNGDIPLTSPYADAPETASAIPGDAVDWVVLEARYTVTGQVPLKRSYFLRKDGFVTETDGTTIDLALPGIPSGDYYVSIRHRNQLLAITATRVSLFAGQNAEVDFTTGLSQFYNPSSAVELEAGIYGVRAGDADGDGYLTTGDYTVWYNSFRLAANGYEPGDFNFDGYVTAEDYNLWLTNALAGSASFSQ